MSRNRTQSTDISHPVGMGIFGMLLLLIPPIFIIWLIWNVITGAPKEPEERRHYIKMWAIYFGFLLFVVLVFAVSIGWWTWWDNHLRELYPLAY